MATEAARAEGSPTSEKGDFVLVSQRAGFMEEATAAGSRKGGLGMEHKKLRLTKGFRVVLGSRSAQAAEMTLAVGDSEGGPDNRHRGSDQWLFVVAGKGVAIVNKRRYALRAGTLLLIEHGDTHEIRNTGPEPLRTLNVYVPPAYTAKGDPLPRGRS